MKLLIFFLALSFGSFSTAADPSGSDTGIVPLLRNFSGLNSLNIAYDTSIHDDDGSNHTIIHRKSRLIISQGKFRFENTTLDPKTEKTIKKQLVVFADGKTTSLDVIHRIMSENPGFVLQLPNFLGWIQDATLLYKMYHKSPNSPSGGFFPSISRLDPDFLSLNDPGKNTSEYFLKFSIENSISSRELRANAFGDDALIKWSTVNDKCWPKAIEIFIKKNGAYRLSNVQSFSVESHPGKISLPLESHITSPTLDILEKIEAVVENEDIDDSLFVIDPELADTFWNGKEAIRIKK